MSFYIKISRLNGRKDLLTLGDWLNRSGVAAVEYFDGGWEDRSFDAMYSHLKFEREDDAIAYVLVHGGAYSLTPPMISGTYDANSDKHYKNY